jgi:hypothetical protein
MAPPPASEVRCRCRQLQPHRQAAARCFMASGRRVRGNWRRMRGWLAGLPGELAASCAGVFAAGDVKDWKWRQAITAAGSGRWPEPPAACLLVRARAGGRRGPRRPLLSLPARRAPGGGNLRAAACDPRVARGICPGCAWPACCCRRPGGDRGGALPSGGARPGGRDGRRGLAAAAERGLGGQGARAA